MCEQVEKIKINYGLEMRQRMVGSLQLRLIGTTLRLVLLCFLPRWVSTEYLMHIGWVCVWI